MALTEATEALWHRRLLPGTAFRTTPTSTTAPGSSTGPAAANGSMTWGGSRGEILGSGVDPTPTSTSRHPSP